MVASSHSSRSFSNFVLAPVGVPSICGDNMCALRRLFSRTNEHVYFFVFENITYALPPFLTMRRRALLCVFAQAHATSVRVRERVRFSTNFAFIHPLPSILSLFYSLPLTTESSMVFDFHSLCCVCFCSNPQRPHPTRKKKKKNLNIGARASSSIC